MRGLHSVGVVAVAFAGALWLSPAAAQPTTIMQDAKQAIANYADMKVRETIKDQSKAAIIALYKKVYRSGADKRLVRTLGEVALSAEEINTFAENAANAIFNGDPEAVKEASSQVAVALGKTLVKGLKDPELRGQMASLLGGVDKVKEIADVLGQAAGGDSTAALEFAGRALIAMTPAAAAFNAAELSVRTMRYLHGKFVDGNVEELYRRYVDGDDDTRAAIRLQLETAPLYSYIIRDYRRTLEDERVKAIATATVEPGEKVRERLTAAGEHEVIDRILDTFVARAAEERAAAVNEQARKQAEAEAAAMIDALDSTAFGRYGKDWSRQRSYDFERFMKAVRERMQSDGVLDPTDRRHIATMSRLLATRLVYGANSAEYRRQLKDFEAFRKTLQGHYGKPAPEPAAVPPAPAPAQEPAVPPASGCGPGSEADRLWAEVLRIERVADQLSARAKQARWVKGIWQSVANEYDKASNMLKKSLALCPSEARRQKMGRLLSLAAAARVAESMGPRPRP